MAWSAGSKFAGQESSADILFSGMATGSGGPAYLYCVVGVMGCVSSVSLNLFAYASQPAAHFGLKCYNTGCSLLHTA